MVAKNSAFGRLLGLQIVKAEAGEAIVELSMQDSLRNLHGKLHGGALFSLLDTAMALASHSLTDGEPSSVTLECKLNYLRPVSEGELSCRAWVVHAGRRTQLLEAEARQNGKLLAKAQATFACL
jgi:uncharacterized protein (TIGR00369 family)